MSHWRNKLYHLLRWSEKYTKTDMVYLSRGAWWLSASQLVATLAGLVSAIALANLISPETLGNYRFILSAAGFIGAFALTGMGSSVTRSTAKGYKGTILIGVKTRLKWGLITTVISLIAAGYYTYHNESTLAIGFVLIGLFMPIIDSLSLFKNFLEGMKEFRTEAIYNTFRIIIPIIVVIITIYLTNNLITILVWYFISNLLVLTVCYYLVIRKYRPDDTADSEAVNYGVHLSLMDILPTMSLYLDKILIFYFVSPAGLAVYSLAMSPVEQMRNLNKILNRLAFPKLSQRNYREINLTERVLKMSAFMLMIVLLYIITAPFIFSLIFPQYLESVKYSQLYSLILIILPFTLFGQALTAHHKKRELYIAKTLSPIFGLILLAILLPLYGLWGAITAILLAKLFNAMIVVYLFYKTRKTSQ